MTSSDALLGIDLGTTSVKAAVISTTGELLGIGRATYPLATPRPTIAEQDPDAWWSALAWATREALSRASGHGPVRLLAVSAVGQGPTTVCTARDGTAIGLAITWLDGRAAAAAAALSASIGVPPWQLGSLPHERWLARHDSRRHERTAWFLAPWDWIVLRLAGEAVRSVPPGSRHPTDATLRAGGADPLRFGRAVEWATPVGQSLPGPSGELGIEPGVPVIAGGNDALASFHGAGLVGPGDAVDTGGTSGGFGVYWDHELDVPGTYRAPAALPGMWLYGGAMNSIGKSVEWLLDILSPAATSPEASLAEAERTPPGAGGLVFLPYLAGERAPIEDERARGMFAGLSLAHGRGHLVRAVLEAGGYALRHVAEPIVAAGVTVERLIASGATPAFGVATQARADITGIRVGVPLIPETAVLGAAILAAVGVGVHADARAAIARMVRIRAWCEPRPELRARYDDLYGVYRSLYPRTAELVHRLADIADSTRSKGAQG